MVPLSVFPLLLAYFGLTAPELGVVASMWSITSVIGSPAIGHISDRLKRNNTLLIVGLAMMALGVVGTGWSVTTGTIRSFLPLGLYPALLLFAAIGGLGSSVCHPIGGTVLSQVYPPSRIGTVLGLNGSIGSLGRALYPTLVVILIAALNLPYGVATLGLLGLIPAAMIGVFPIHDSRDSHRIKIEYGKGRDRDTRFPGSPFIAGSVRMSVLVLTLIAMIRGLFNQGFVSFLSVFAVEVQKYSFSYGVGVIMMIAIILGVPGQLVFGYLSDRHRIGSLVTNNLGQSLMVMIYLYTPSSSIASATCLAVFGFFAYSNYPVYLSAVSESVPTESLSLANSIVWGIGLLGGSAIGPIIVGLFVGNDLSLLPTIFLSLAAVSGFSTLLVAFLPRRSKAQVDIHQ